MTYSYHVVCFVINIVYTYVLIFQLKDLVQLKILVIFVQNICIMKRLTQKEEEIMDLFWEKGTLCVKDMQMFYPEPRPHVNTLSTIVRILEDKGFVGHEAVGKSYRYYALIGKDEYKKDSLLGVVDKYFNNSYLGVVSSLINEEYISVKDLKYLINLIEGNTQK